MNEQTWLPRFTADDFIQAAQVFMGVEISVKTLNPNFAATFINRRLEEIEKTCTRTTGYISKDGSFQRYDVNCTHEALMLPPRPIKRGVSKAEILQAVTSCKDAFENHNLPRQFSKMHDLLIRIEREGITE